MYLPTPLGLLAAPLADAGLFFCVKSQSPNG